MKVNYVRIQGWTLNTNYGVVNILSGGKIAIRMVGHGREVGDSDIYDIKGDWSSKCQESSADIDIKDCRWRVGLDRKNVV